MSALDEAVAELRYMDAANRADWAYARVAASPWWALIRRWALLRRARLAEREMHDWHEKVMQITRREAARDGGA